MKNNQYSHPCPHGCGANLDPGERCNCQDVLPANESKKPDRPIKEFKETKPNKEPVMDSLILGIDMAADEDVPVISVARFDGAKLVFVKCLVGDDARRIYKELTDPAPLKSLEPKDRKSTFIKEDLQ